ERCGAVMFHPHSWHQVRYGWTTGRIVPQLGHGWVVWADISPPMMPGSAGGQQLLDGRIVLAFRWAHLRPSAPARVLVRAEAQQARPVAEAVALHLVVAHLDHELRPDGCFLEAARPPAVRLREAARVGAFEQWLHEGQDLGLSAGCDRARADVVEPAVLLVETEQERRERGR